MHAIVNVNECCGCGACAAVCPKECISMEERDCGFIFPVIDESKCIDCRKCNRVCPAFNTPSPDKEVVSRWVYAKDLRVLDNSSSGGVFALLAHDVLANGGVVCGAAWEEGCASLRHRIIEDVDRLDPIFRSKYVQSAVPVDVFKELRHSLESRRPTLFCGTGCQVAGVRSYLGQLADSDYLLLVEVICHGVPSPQLWKKWLDHVGERYGNQVTSVNFRCKDSGWRGYNVCYMTSAQHDANSVLLKHKFIDDWYMRAFIRNASLRDSCFTCPVKRASGSDITLGDYWGIELSHPGVGEDDRGVSAVITNTSRGERALRNVLPQCTWGMSKLDSIAKGNPSLIVPVIPNAKRSAFITSLNAGASIEELMQNWSFKPTLAKRIISKVKAVMGHLRIMR